MGSPETTTTAISNTMSFEEALQELERIVRQLEDEKFSLEDAIKAYERGIALRGHCEEILLKARMKIEKISVAAHAKDDANKANVNVNVSLEEVTLPGENGDNQG